MERKNESRYDTAFTTSIEARTGVTTGISASDRSITIKTAINEQNNESHITTPGHIFPIIARDGGTLVRAGHTEAVVDIAKLSGLNPSGVICEIMKDNGEMARLPDLIEFAKEHNIKIGTIADLISYRRKNEKIVKRSTERNFLSNFGGEWRIIVYKSLIDDIEHIALVKGFINDESSTLVRVHSFNAMTDLLGEKSFDKAENILSKSMKLISGKGKGVIILINDSFQEFLSKKIKISIQNSGDTKSELRNYGVGAQILSDLGFNRCHPKPISILPFISIVFSRVSLSSLFFESNCERAKCDRSSAVENICSALVGIVVFFSINFVVTPPNVSIPRDNGVTSSNRTSFTSPERTPPWIAAPMATASSGFTSFLGSTPKKDFTSS